MANIKWELLSEKERQAMLKIVSSDNALRGMPTFQEWCAAQSQKRRTEFVIGLGLGVVIMGSIAVVVTLVSRW